ncbi:hypothetical protein PAMA_002379 [Pampus argenteus]
MDGSTDGIVGLVAELGSGTEKEGGKKILRPRGIKEQKKRIKERVFAKCRYVYYGKHSEGNRFIRNDQL